jgi:glycosyltransferase involved in cell wall biosynthesis
MFPPQEDYEKGAPVEKLNKIYNASDVYLTTATGGGWELPVTEAMATKLPVILPNHTSLGELGDNGSRGWMLEELYPTVAMVDNVVRYQSDMYEIAETLSIVNKHIRENSSAINEKVNRAYMFVTSLDWDVISKDFIKAIRQLTK